MTRHLFLAFLTILNIGPMFGQTRDSLPAGPIVVRFPEIGWHIELPAGYSEVDPSGTSAQNEYADSNYVHHFMARGDGDGFVWINLWKLSNPSVEAYDSAMDGMRIKLSEGLVKMPNAITELNEERDTIGTVVFRRFIWSMHEELAPWKAGALIKKEAMMGAPVKGYELWFQYDYQKEATGAELLACFRRSGQFLKLKDESP